MDMINKTEYFKTSEEKFSFISLFYDKIDVHMELLEKYSRTIDWRHMFAIGIKNHLFGFYYRVLKNINTGCIPKDFFEGCRNHFFFNDAKIRIYFREIQKFNELMGNCKINYVMTRGYVYYYLLYNKLPVREFNDIDIYVRKEDVREVIRCLVSAGYINPGEKKIRYFLKHHIHIRVENPVNKIVFEVHWAVDHNYNLIDIPVDDLLNSKVKVIIEGSEISVPSLERDFLISAVHALKHSPLLKYSQCKSDFFEMLFKNSSAVKYLDLYRIIKLHGDSIDWQLLIRISKDCYCDDYLHVVLSLLKYVFDAPVKDEILDKLSGYSPGFLEKTTAKYLISRSDTFSRNNGFLNKAAAKIINSCKNSLIFNPVRFIDLFRYLIPPSRYMAYLKKKNVSLLKRNRIYLFLRGIMHLFRNLIDAMIGHQDLLFDD